MVEAQTILLHRMTGKHQGSRDRRNRRLEDPIPRGVGAVTRGHLGSGVVRWEGLQQVTPWETATAASSNLSRVEDSLEAEGVMLERGVQALAAVLRSHQAGTRVQDLVQRVGGRVYHSLVMRDNVSVPNENRRVYIMGSQALP